VTGTILRSGDHVGLGVVREGVDHSELLERYRAYRRRQARRLLRLLPREAVRPLYRRAAASEDPATGSDPLETLVRYCERLLPLPPFEAWRDDVASNPVAHLHDVDDSAEAPSAEAPVTVATRDFVAGDRAWSAHLRSFRDGEAWRGFIAFEDRGSARLHRTALIFRESDPVDVRERFMSFEPRALMAFLRSALP
jgi:hypothetical protein